MSNLLTFASVLKIMGSLFNFCRTFGNFAKQSDLGRVAFRALISVNFLPHFLNQK